MIIYLKNIEIVNWKNQKDDNSYEFLVVIIWYFCILFACWWNHIFDICVVLRLFENRDSIIDFKSGLLQFLKDYIFVDVGMRFVANLYAAMGIHKILIIWGIYGPYLISTIY